MKHSLFKPQTLEEGKHAVVGDCNGFKMQDRWNKETPLFASAILNRGGKYILDYGCGVGRLAKEILLQNKDVTLVGTDASDKMMETANKYVESDRFTTSAPQDLGGLKFDLIYCVYVLQHVPAIEIREILQRIHHYLKDDGFFVYCSSDCRMAVRFDTDAFFNDEFLGVDLRAEVERYFEYVEELFDKQTLEQNFILRRMVAGEGGFPHPARVYRKRKISGPLFNAKAQNVTPVPKEILSPEIIKKKDYTDLVLINRLAPGDILVMTNALRDLHKTYPGKYRTEVRTPCNAIFDNNPYVSKVLYDEGKYQRFEKDLHGGEKNGAVAAFGDALVIDMHYPLIHTSGEAGWHFGYGHRAWLEEVLEKKIAQTCIRPEIYLSQSERDWISPVLMETGFDEPYWVINAGSKDDFTLKQYPYYQEVVDLLKDKVNLVQIGLIGHRHAGLDGAINMVGKTNDVRKLFRLIHKAQGVITCVSFPMHIAAAFNKPCVVVAGGREGPRWEMYPNHQYLYVNGCLPCAPYDGCWKSKFEDCVNKDGDVPKCMRLIKPQDIVRAVERYYEGGVLQPKG